MEKSYLTIQVKTQWLLSALLLTVLAIPAYDWIPARKFNLLGSNPQTSLFMDSESTGSSQGSWLGKSRHAFRCTFYDTPADYKFCGFDIDLSKNTSEGIDFSRFHTLHFRLYYQGESELLRFYIRNFSEHLSDINDTRNTAKYSRILLPTVDFKKEVSVPLSQFSLADWWVRDMNLSTEHAFPEFNNVINLGIDHTYPAPFGNHDIQVLYITLEGMWITRENWYLSIIGFWFLVLILKNTHQFHLYLKQLKSGKK